LQQTCPTTISSTTNPIWPDLGSNLAAVVGSWWLNCLSYGSYLLSYLLSGSWLINLNPLRAWRSKIDWTILLVLTCVHWCEKSFIWPQPDLMQIFSIPQFWYRQTFVNVDSIKLKSVLSCKYPLLAVNFILWMLLYPTKKLGSDTNTTDL
jgi:hypothetical protein